MNESEKKKKKLSENEKIELLSCSFQFYEFSTQVGEVKIHCHIIKMQDSLYLWVGNAQNPVMSDLSVAMLSNYETVPVSTKLVGTMDDFTSINLAKRLSKKIGKMVYISFNISVDNLTLPEIEKRIQEEFITHSELLSF